MAMVVGVIMFLAAHSMNHEVLQSIVLGIIRCFVARRESHKVYLAHTRSHEVS